MKLYQYLAKALVIISFYVDNSSALGDHVCTRMKSEAEDRWGSNPFHMYMRERFRHRLNFQSYHTEYFCCMGYTGSVDNCQPNCFGRCGTHSSCVAPFHCQCDEGYQRTRLYGMDCSPVCRTACGPHSTCAKPDFCECIAGYQRNPQSATCEPVCEPSCGSNQFCKSPNRCECLEGHTTGETGECNPVCVACGPHSLCLKPGVCQCKEGYYRSEEEKCEPVCSVACGEHSFCQSPEKCECDEGYTQKEPNVCEAVCNPECQHGECIAPQTCLCNAGYEPESAALGHLCRPRCQENCVNATCTAPDQCTCLDGFVPSLQGNSSICQPNCSQGCRNGFCVAPETCVCPDGYESTPNGCHQPIDFTPHGPSSSTNPPITTSPDISKKDAAHNAHSKQNEGGSVGKIILISVVGVCIIVGFLIWILRRKPEHILDPDEVAIVDGDADL